MSDFRWASSLFAAAFLARLVASLGNAIFGTDGCHYLLMADWMREGRFQDALQIAYHPMYPLLIATARIFFATTEQAGAAVSVLFGAAASLPLFHMVRAVFGRPTAVLTTLFYAFSPSIVLVQSDVMTEGTFMFFLFSSMWLTWRMMEQPSLERGAVLGAAAAAAFLTRPEGLLAIFLALGWPLLLLVRRRDALLMRSLGLALTLVVVVLMISPYVLWVKSERGRWALSVRPSALSAEKTVGFSEGNLPDSEQPPPPSHYYGILLKGVFRLTLYGVWVPFYVAGLMSLRGFGPGKAFYFSLPLAHLAGILYTLQTHPFMADRYLMAPMILMSALGAAGLVSTFKVLARRWPEARWRPAACGALILLLAIVPGVRALKVRRAECLSYPVAARKILEQGPRPRAMSGPAEQVAYHCGARSFYSASTHEGIRRQIDRNRVDCYVYSESDVERRRDYIQMLRSCPSLSPPVEVTGPPGTEKVYYQRSK